MMIRTSPFFLVLVVVVVHFPTSICSFSLATVSSSSRIVPPLPLSSSSCHGRSCAGRQATFGVRSSLTTPTASNPTTRLYVSFRGNSENVDVLDRARIRDRRSNDTSTSVLTMPFWTPSVGGTSQTTKSTQSLVNSIPDASTSSSSPYNANIQQASSPIASPVTFALVALVALGGAFAATSGGLGSWFDGDALSSSPLFVTDSLDATTTFATVSTFVQHLISNPQETMQSALDTIHNMGPMGLVYFGLIYWLAEVLAVPATPLTLSAGYLFGVGPGTAVVLVAATLAASVSFFIGKTFLRSWVEDKLQDNPKFAKLDRAIGQQGFPLLLLVRLSPIFPFALSNYLYGASSIDFVSYFWGTLLGFAPGTVAYVYTGMVGKALTLGGGEGGGQPWYFYAGGLGLLVCALKLVTDVATNIIESMDDDDNEKDTEEVTRSLL